MGPSTFLSITPITNHQILAKYYSSLSLLTHCHWPCLCHHCFIRISAVTSCFPTFLLVIFQRTLRKADRTITQKCRSHDVSSSLQPFSGSKHGRWKLTLHTRLSTIWLLPSLGSFRPSFLLKLCWSF